MHWMQAIKFRVQKGRYKKCDTLLQWWLNKLLLFCGKLSGAVSDASQASF